MEYQTLGIPLETLKNIEDTYLRFTLDDIPTSPMIPQEILDAIPLKHLDIQYGNDNPYQLLDIYLPPEAKTKKVPLFIHLHGGGWMAGDKQDMQTAIYFGLLNHGYAIASVEYRLSGVAQFPDPIKDCKTAVRFMKAHALEYGIDPARIAIGGGSAGAHIALLIATSPNIAYLEDLSMGSPNYGTDVRCVVAAYPPTKMSLIGSDDPSTPENAFMGGIINNMDTHIVDMASPYYFVTPQIPPVFLRAGNADALVPYTQTKLLAEHIENVAGSEKVDWRIVEGAGHADPAFKMPSYLSEVIDFLDLHMKA